MSKPDEFVTLLGGVVVPLPALEAQLDLERAGHRLLLDGDDIIIEPARGMPLPAAQVDALRRWKLDVRMLILHQPGDSHMDAGHRGAPDA